jgi:integrase
MASVVRDPRGRSPFWYACYTDATGKRLKKSTRLTAKSKALEMARGLQKAADEAKRGALTEARTRELLGQILQSVTGQTLRMFTVAKWLDHFVKQKKKSRAEKTAARHEQVMTEFVQFLGARAEQNMAAITAKEISDFRDQRHARGLTPTTVNLDVTVLSSAFNAALKQGLIPVNPCASIEALKDKAHRKHVFNPEQISALVKVAEGDWKGLIVIAFYTGQRLGDCANLRWRDVDLHKRTIRFQAGKTGDEVVSMIHPQLEEYLLSLPTAKSDDQFVFPTLAQRTVSPLSEHFRKLLKRAGIAQHVIREGNKAGRTVYGLSFHSLRHSFSSILANAGVSEELRMALTGHRSRDVHQRYTHHELKRMRAAVEKLPALGIK